MSDQLSNLGQDTRQPRWNGEPCEARRVRVIVADNERFPMYWARHLVGAERDAVEVTYNGSTFYIDDEGYDERPEVQKRLRAAGMDAPERVGHPGWGWEKVLNGGGPQDGHASLEIARVVSERRACDNCGERPATVRWGLAMEAIHGQAKRWCKVCALTAQVEHARERAAALPDLERRLALAHGHKHEPTEGGR